MDERKRVIDTAIQEQLDWLQKLYEKSQVSRAHLDAMGRIIQGYEGLEKNDGVWFGVLRFSDVSVAFTFDDKIEVYSRRNDTDHINKVIEQLCERFLHPPMPYYQSERRSRSTLWDFY